MECFSGFWSRRLYEGENTPPWIFDSVGKTPFPTSEVFDKLDSSRDNPEYIQQLFGTLGIMEDEDLRKVLEEKARRHHTYYETLVGIDETDRVTSTTEQKMAPAVGKPDRDYAKADDSSANVEDNEAGSQGSLERKYRQRRQGVYEITGTLDQFSSRFRSVKQLRENYMTMLEKTYKHLSVDDKPGDLAKKEKSELLVPPSSGYCSSSASGASDDERDKEKSWSEKKLPVRRCASSDSAVHSDDEVPIVPNWGEKKEEDRGQEVFRRSPYSPRASIDHSNVRSRTIIPAQYVPLPISRKFSVDCVSDVPSDNVSDSRRESCFSEGDEQPRYRYWRTPSVVVSDYSDDILGLTLEDIEYIRSKRHSISPDSSLHSSCSNLNYCGSSISGIEGDYVLSKPYRKSSNCSTCSTLSDEEEGVQEPSLQARRTKEVSLSLHFQKASMRPEMPKSGTKHNSTSTFKDVNDSRVNSNDDGTINSNDDGTKNAVCSLTMPKNQKCHLSSPEIRCSPSPCVFDWDGESVRRCGENTLYPNRSSSRSPSPASDTSPRLGRRGSGLRRSTSPSSPVIGSRRGSTTGYEQYQKSLLEVPICFDYGDPSSDDLSSEWDSDAPEPRKESSSKPSGWRKLRNIVQWTPFFQTYKKQRYPWVQLAGHQGNFKAGPDQGTILKKLCAKEEKCFKILMKDVLRPYVPEYKGLVASDDGECSYIQLQDLLGDFVTPCVMDCKIGVRTYLEEELAKAKEKPKLRKDMYEKMCQIDQNAPTEEEHKMKGVTKPRYMVWRETISSTATLGFRIEGIRSADGTSTKDFKTTKTKEQVIAAFETFTEGFPHAIPKYIQRLKAIKATLETSTFFSSHEVIGSSLLFVHDRYNANVWLIDFAKTIVLPEDVKITHNSKWKVGNHEDGYFIGISNLIKIFMTMLEQQPITISPPLTLHEPPEVAQGAVEKT